MIKTNLRVVIKFLLLIISLYQTQLAAESFKTQPVILVLGDSLSAAHGMKLEESWVNLLQQRLNDEGYSYQLVNSSISGDTSLAALNRLRIDIDRYRPTLCLIVLGGNDGLQGKSPSLLKRNLSEIMELCERYVRRSFLFEIKLPMNYGPAYIKQFLNVYRDVSSRYDATLVPFFAEGVVNQSSMMLPDGIHPNANAQPFLMEFVWPYLESWL